MADSVSVVFCFIRLKKEKKRYILQCHSDKDDEKSTGTEISSGLFFC